MIAPRVDDSIRRSFVVGLGVTSALVVAGTVTFFLGQGKGLVEAHATITTDFRSITGLRRGSPVQLSGVEIGQVRAIAFEATSYPCDPLVEDYGRPEDGRRDDCDAQTFCAPEGYCAELEPFEPTAHHARCRRDQDCAPDELCVTDEFRRRYPGVFWGGDPGLCGHYETVLNRVRVTLAIEADKLPLIGRDAVAKVASNSVLGDQLVELSRGDGPPVEPGSHIRSEPSLMENLETFRARIELALGRFDEGLARATGAFERMNDPRTTARIKDGIFALGENVENVAQGRGTLGYWFGAEALGDVRSALSGARAVSGRVRAFASEGQQRLAAFDERMQPAIDHARQQMADLRGRVESLHTDPERARLFVDYEGAAFADLRAAFARVDDVLTGALEGEGALGALVTRDDGWRWLLDLLGFTARMDTLRTVVRRAYEAHERGDTRGRAALGR